MGKFVVLSTVLTMTCISDQTMWNYELGVLSEITTIKMQFVGISYFQEVTNLFFYTLCVDRKLAYLYDSVLKMSSGIYVNPLRFHISTLQKQ